MTLITNGDILKKYKTNKNCKARETECFIQLVAVLEIGGSNPAGRQFRWAAKPGQIL